MKTLYVYAAVAALCCGISAQAATLDLTNRNFDSEVTRTFTESGIDFTFTATDNFVGGPRLLGGDNGIQVGGGGGSSIEFSLAVSDDVTLTGYGTNEATGFSLASPIFDLLDGATVLLNDALINNPASTNIFNSSGENVVDVSGLSIALNAGTTYTFDINNIGAAVQGFITSLDFEVADAAPIPVPAGLPMLAAGIGVFAWMRRKTA